MKRKQLSLTIHGVLALSLLAVTPAFAQDAGSSNAGQDEQKDAKKTEPATLETVMVTARRRAESIQEVPIAITAFSESELQDLQASNLAGLQGAVPNMNIVQGRGSANSLNVFIRGIGQPDALQTFDPGVGIYVDDVYYSRINGALFSLFDVAQVEVLRGPQGTLYGKNSTGGAIKMSTKDPFDYHGGSLEATFGDYGRAEGRFYVGGKLNDTIAGSIAGGWIKSDGYVENGKGGKPFNNDDTRALRGKLAFKPSENFVAVLSADYTKQDAALTMGRPMADLIQTDLVFGPVVLQRGETGNWDYTAETSFPPGKGQEMTHSGVSLNMVWNISDAWLFKSISAYRKLSTNSYIDIDASKYQLGDVLVALDQNQSSQEFQLQYNNGSDLHATFGAYWLHENVPSYQEAYASDLYAVAGTPIAFKRTISDDLSTTSTALFAQVNWEFVPTWTLTAGARWTRDKKDYERTTSTFWGPPFTAINETVPFPKTSATWTAVTPTFSVQKEFSDGLMGYLSANRGYKSGGFNGRANSGFDVIHAKYQPEYVWTYEGGLKMQSADRRMNGSVAVFHSDYRDFQARVADPVNPGAAIPSFSFPVLNAAKLVIDGIEFQGVALIGASTQISAELGWMNARYAEFVDPQTIAKPWLHDHVPFSPDFTGRVAIQHAIDLDNGSVLTFGGDISNRSETWLSVDNREGLRQGAYTLFGVYGVFDTPDGKWQFRGGIRNLTNQSYKTDGQEFSSVGNIQTAYYGMPRNLYLSARYNF